MLPQPSTKLLYLEGLRGVAALAVVFGHYYNGWYSAPTIFSTQLNPVLQSIIKSPLCLLWDGRFAVSIFFVLSGYVLSCKFFRTHNKDVIVSSALRRYWRLAIPSLASLLLAWLLLATHAYFNQETATITSSYWLTLFWKFTPDLVQVWQQGLYDIFFSYEDAMSYNAVLWTMHWELYGSFCVFALCLLSAKIKHRWLLYGFVSLLLLKQPYLLGFILGVIISDCHSQCNKWPSNNHPFYVLLFFFSLGLAYLLPALQSLIASDILSLLYIIAAFVLVVAIHGLPAVQRFLSNTFCAYLGRISFSLYLVHLPLLGSVACYTFLTLQSFTQSYTLGFLGAFWGGMSITLLSAHYFCQYIDQPAIQFASQFEKSLKFLYRNICIKFHP
jgi:peptidoglycan/LPS O-acetylase OafA/YrhL